MNVWRKVQQLHETTMDIYAEVTDAKKKEAIENLSHNLDIF